MNAADLNIGDVARKLQKKDPSLSWEDAIVLADAKVRERAAKLLPEVRAQLPSPAVLRAIAQAPTVPDSNALMRTLVAKHRAAGHDLETAVIMAHHELGVKVIKMKRKAEREFRRAYGRELHQERERAGLFKSTTQPTPADAMPATASGPPPVGPDFRPGKRWKAILDEENAKGGEIEEIYTRATQRFLREALDARNAQDRAGTRAQAQRQGAPASSVVTPPTAQPAQPKIDNMAGPTLQSPDPEAAARRAAPRMRLDHGFATAYALGGGGANATPADMEQAWMRRRIAKLTRKGRTLDQAVTMAAYELANMKAGMR
jgi:hypothetical protein